MNLPCEFEQAVKYVMSVWPGSRSETKSETVFCFHAYMKKITQWKQQFIKIPFECPQPIFSPHHIFNLQNLSDDKEKKILKIKLTSAKQRFRKSKQHLEYEALKYRFPKAIENPPTGENIFFQVRTQKQTLQVGIFVQDHNCMNIKLSFQLKTKKHQWRGNEVHREAEGTAAARVRCFRHSCSTNTYIPASSPMRSITTHPDQASSKLLMNSHMDSLLLLVI